MNEKMWNYFIQVLKSESQKESWKDIFSSDGEGFISDSGVACLPIRHEQHLEAGESLQDYFSKAKEPWRLLCDHSQIADGQIQEIIDGNDLRSRLKL